MSLCANAHKLTARLESVKDGADSEGERYPKYFAVVNEMLRTYFVLDLETWEPNICGATEHCADDRDQKSSHT